MSQNTKLEVNKNNNKKENDRRETLKLKPRVKMAACSLRLRQEVHHGGLELWLISMRLGGIETHTHTPFEGQYERTDTLNHSQSEHTENSGIAKHTQTHLPT